MDKFVKRLTKREVRIRNGLKKRNLDLLLIKSDQIIDSPPRKDIK